MCVRCEPIHWHSPSSLDTSPLYASSFVASCIERIDPCRGFVAAVQVVLVLAHLVFHRTPHLVARVYFVQVFGFREIRCIRHGMSVSENHTVANKASMTFPLGNSSQPITMDLTILARQSQWTHADNQMCIRQCLLCDLIMDTLGFEPGPSACEANVIPLHHVPLGCFRSCSSNRLH